MPNLLLDPLSGDLAIVNGAIGRTNDASGQTAQQGAENRLRLILGEWFLDTRLGVDYLGTAFVKNPNLGAVEQMLRQAILATPGIATITAFSITFDRTARSGSVTWSATTDTGAAIGATTSL